MKLMLTTFSLLLLPLFLHCQSKVSFSIVGSADYAYRYLSSSSEPSTLSIVDSRNEQERGNIKARFGFNCSIELAHNFFIKSGLRYANIGYILDKSDILLSSIDFIAAQENSLETVEQIGTVDHFFFEVPIVVRYEFPKKMISFFVEAGLSPYIYLTTKNKQTTETRVRTITGSVTRDLDRLQIAGSISFGFNYDLNVKWQLFGQPIVRYHFTSLTRGNPVKENLYTLGLELGVRRFLK